VRDALKSYLALATGVTDLTRQTAWLPRGRW
jgi:hypothetical protein